MDFPKRVHITERVYLAKRVYLGPVVVVLQRRFRRFLRYSQNVTVRISTVLEVLFYTG